MGSDIDIKSDSSGAGSFQIVCQQRTVASSSGLTAADANQSRLCYLPGTAFKSPDGKLVLAENLRLGDSVSLQDGSNATIAWVQKFERDEKRKLVEVITS